MVTNSTILKNKHFLYLFFVLASCNSLKKTPTEPQALNPTQLPPEVAPIEEKRSAVNFVESEMLKPVLQQAQKENKLVFVDFYTTWCLPCLVMDEEVFVDEELGNYMNQNFISLKIDAEKGNGITLSTIFSIRAYPTLLFLDPSGKILSRKEGMIFPKELRALGEEALTQVTPKGIQN